MRRSIAMLLVLASFAPLVLAQTPPQTQPEPTPEDVIRITSELVQTDVVVIDKSDQIIKDLSLEDFEVYDNGRRQSLKFMEFVGADSPRRSEGTGTPLPVTVEPATSNGLSARVVKRVIAFVIDDLTMEIGDLPSVRTTLLDFVNNK